MGNEKLPERVWIWTSEPYQWHDTKTDDSDVEYARVDRKYFCSCGAALTAEEYITHYFELGHDRGDSALHASAAPREPTLADLAYEAATFLDESVHMVSDGDKQRAQQIAFALRTTISTGNKSDFAYADGYNNGFRQGQQSRISPAAPVVDKAPIDMVLFCPRCGTQHIDAPEDETSFRHRMEAWSLNAEWQDRTPQRWTNPPHKSHLCHNCFAVWRPADVPTNGVAQIKTRGKEDNTWTNSAAVPAAATAAPQQSDKENG